MHKSLIKPFGEICFENEKDKLGDRWEEYFFDHTPFVNTALDFDTYLIIGRRGSGKSSLAAHFAYQDKYKNALCINVDHDEAYSSELFDIAKKLEYSAEIAIQKLVTLWDYMLWQLIFKKLSDTDEIFKSALDDSSEINSTKTSSFFKILLRGVADKFISKGTGSEILDFITKYKKDDKIKGAETQTFITTKKNPIFIVIDSPEKYHVKNNYEMWITAALIQSASEFNMKYSTKGIHVKVCIADEVFPYLKEEHITNTLKYVRDPLYMQWRPKDLIRLLCWRFFKFLKSYDHIKFNEQDINWDSFDDIYKKLWLPYFGETIVNRRGVTEKTFPYILRHTQLRPRQLVLICNKIAKIAIHNDEFPFFSKETILHGIMESEVDLADEIINSYQSIYTNVGNIISALEGQPLEFLGGDLTRIAHRTASEWDTDDYSPLNFMKLCLEIGVIGRKRGKTDNYTGIIKADFEFAVQDRLFINEKDTCVMHPLFYSKLNINRTNPVNNYVYPFPDNQDFLNIQ